MENSPIIRFRVDREIAARAHRMAAEAGLELPDVMRMMLTRAVRIGDFSIDQERSARPTSDPAQQTEAYEPRYWADAQAALDADTALAVLHHVIAGHTTALDEGLTLKVPDLVQLEQIRNERDEACALLASFDPNDTAKVARILERFNPSTPSGGIPGAAA